MFCVFFPLNSNKSAGDNYHHIWPNNEAFNSFPSSSCRFIHEKSKNFPSAHILWCCLTIKKNVFCLSVNCFIYVRNKERNMSLNLNYSRVSFWKIMKLQCEDVALNFSSFEIRTAVFCNRDHSALSGTIAQRTEIFETF